MLTVYKASAGSGKTFQLVVEYLKLLVENPHNFRNILAVTFTNKATNEMKSRILEQLNLLGNNEKSDYLAILSSELSLSEKMVRKQAKQALKLILHDYNRFSVNTIDSFTQRVIKAFNREMNISPHFTLELDNSMVLEEAVDRLLSKLDTDPKLRKWLVQFSEEKIKENYSQQIEEDIKQLGKELFNEKFQLFFPEKDESVYTRENLESFRDGLTKMTTWFENTLKTKAQKAVEIIIQSGFSFDDFSYNLTGVAGYLKNLSEGNIKDPGSRVLDAEQDSEKWVKKQHPQKKAIVALVESNLQPALRDILAFYRENRVQYCTAAAVKKQLRMLGILTDLKEEVKALLQEKATLQISDSNLLLSKIIGNSESPFIYEKIGNQFSYFMLDEFQDTSALQWHNFRPLVENSLSEGNKNLLVGDVKQSIYRWRNSDWNILATGIAEAFPDVQEKALENNWRSDLNIIDFNNAAIESLKNTFEEFLFDEIDPKERQDYLKKFRKIYEHFVQKPGKPEKERKGLVEINFLEDENFEENSALQLVEEVKQLQDNGLAASETAILIRRNSEGTQIIETFLAAAKQPENSRYNLSVLSSESMFLHTSKGVNFIIFIIELLIDPENKIAKASLLQLFRTWLKPELLSLGITLKPAAAEQILIDFKNKKWQLNPDFEEEFNNEFNQFLENIKEKVLLASLDETITEIAALLQLFKIKSELPFLQALIDKAAEIKTSVSNDLSNLLYWWNEKGYKSSVIVNEDTDSVRLITIHKSKGLEFSAVLIPNFNWESSWSAKLAPTLWCKSAAEPFNRFPLLPVKAAKDLSSTFFKNDFFEEKVNSFIDTLNLVYVAATRAKSVLMIHCKNTDSDKPRKSINSLLKYALNQMSALKDFDECWNQEQTRFQFGQLPVFEQQKKKKASELIKDYRFTNFSERIKLRINSEDFLQYKETNKSVKNLGKLVHEILAAIETKNDVEKACTAALNEGKINNQELETIQNKIYAGLDLPEVQNWFNGSYKVLNERNILTVDKILRPDRIMISGKNAVVVDYKSGEINPEKYNAQVRRYSRKLKETGMEKVEGYLWYINKNEVVKVCEF